MSISVNANTTGQMQSLANELAKAVDGNKDGQISTSEFGTFILNLLQGNLGKASTSTSASIASAAGLTTSGTKTLLPGVARLATTEEIALVKGMRAEEAVAALSDEPPLGFMPEFLGFESDRLEAARTSLKYDAFHVLKSFDPHDPTSIHRAFFILDAMHPGMYELDDQDNLMLTGTADGYIGARPANRDLDWNDRSHQWIWQWMHYNEAHPGPNGETT